MLLVDTNVLLAAADTSTAEHQRCATLLDERTDLAITTPVAAECSWMIESRLGPRAEAAFVTSIAAGELAVIELITTDWARCAELIDTYADLGLGLVDASVIAVAERLGVTTIATMNTEISLCASRPLRRVRAHPLTPPTGALGRPGQSRPRCRC